MTTRASALRMARIYRTCPPISLRGDAGLDERIKEHMRICPHCSETGSTALEWDALASALAGLATRQTRGPCRPGEFRPLLPSEARWRERYYYSPPVVLVLQTGHGPGDAVGVLQIYHDLAMAAPGDIVIPESRAGGMPECFVEPWNRYTLRSSMLDAPLGRISRDTLSAIRRAVDDPILNRPPWAPLPRPMKGEEDPRRFFRELEIEVGYTFAAPAVESIMAGLESPLPRIAYSSLRRLKAALGTIMPGIRWPSNRLASMDELLATFRFPETQLAMAAKDPGPTLATARRIGLVGGQVREVAPLRWELHSQTAVGPERIIAGRLIDPPVPLGDAMLIGFFLLADLAPIPPTLMDWDRDAGVFFMKFEVPPGKDGFLELALLHDLGKE